ncbi:von Willebrand factor type A (VWA)-containing protein [Candidatus Magnetoovum chiemensis]|nr:von Willebrand factor type A (VWA)-containing protein [Candidatus Magnetoovum chiemensis]
MARQCVALPKMPLKRSSALTILGTALSIDTIVMIIVALLPLLLGVFIGIILSIIHPSIVHCAYGEDTDTVLIMDNTELIQQRDIYNFRNPAAKLFITLLDESDRVSIYSSNYTPPMIEDLTAVGSSEDKMRLYNTLDNIAIEGTLNDLTNLLTNAFLTLTGKNLPNRTKHIVLMYYSNETLKDNNVEESLIHTAVDNSIKLHVITFDNSYNKKELMSIAENTGGTFNILSKPEDIHLAFTTIYENIKYPQRLTIVRDTFVVDSSVSELSLLINKTSSNSRIILKSPDGTMLYDQNKTSSVDWISSKIFDKITIRTPKSGKWEIMFSVGKDNKAFVVSDLQLHTNIEGKNLYLNSVNGLDAWITNKDILLNYKELAETIEITGEIKNPSGKSTAISLEGYNLSKGHNAWDGRFINEYEPKMQGYHTINIYARTGSFNRQMSYKVNAIEASQDLIEQARLKQQQLLEKHKEEELLKAKTEEKPDLKETSMTKHGSWLEASVVIKTESFKKDFINFSIINLVLFIFVSLYIRRNRLKVKTS